MRAQQRIIAVSEATARDLTSLLGVRADKLSVIYEAADALYQPVADPQAIQPTLAKYGLSPPFILFVGTIEPRKNLSTLLRAFHHLRSRYKASLQLAVVGKRGWLSDDVFALLDELKLHEDVKLLGPLPAHELAALYNGARCLALPSLYEGFGLTALEAISCGTPVVVSNTSSLPEVVGDAGLCLSPHSSQTTICIAN
ncbi:MAG: glycosyltransferase family 4 protein [Chloroflexi bacterium]|nr:MAG: glycosyltransferase family 4 protein [Chloroflexota bacterium]